MKSALRLRIAVPIGLLILLVLSFGPLIPWLGFFWDDWPVILTGRLQGIQGFISFYQYDRPFSAWTYMVTYPILGDRPINWHIFSLLLRWGTAASLWWVLARIWPNHRREASWAAGLFAVYPVFLQQQVSVAYSQHWICYLLFLLSLGCMVEAQSIRKTSPRWYFWLLTGTAMAASLVQLLTMEYFAGLELLRPVLLWFMITGEPQSIWKKVMQVARNWLPYLLVLAVFTIWRLFFLQFPGEEANPPSLLFQFTTNPISAGLRLLEIAIQDTLHLLVSVWANILSAANINLLDRFTLIAWVWTIVVGTAAVFTLRYMQEILTDTDPDQRRWNRQAMITGFLAILLGMLPVWFTDRQIIVGTYSNRFGLPAMLGASLIVVAFLEEVIARKMQKIVILGVLIGLAAGQHLQTANDFRWSWIKQTRFYWSLSWRAPSIEPQTAITAEGEIFPYVGLYSTAAGVNLIYPQTGEENKLPYWFYSLGREYAYMIDEFRQGVPLLTNFRHYSFTGHSNDILVVYYNPAENDCLHVIAPADFNAPGIPQISIAALENSNLARIQPTGSLGFPPQEIFGQEPEHGWCYQYEKAALAQQFGQWDEIARLGDQARQQGFTPHTPESDTAFEWLPFIEGYAMIGRWEDARHYSVEAFAEDKRINGRMCDLWEKIGLTTTDEQPIVTEVMQKIGCP